MRTATVHRLPRVGCTTPATVGSPEPGHTLAAVAGAVNARAGGRTQATEPPAGRAGGYASGGRQTTWTTRSPG